METTADRSLHASNARLLCLVEAIEHLQAASSPAGVMDVMRRAARRLSDADDVRIVLRKEDEAAPEGPASPLLSAVAGWARSGRRTVVVTDVEADPRIPQEAREPAAPGSLVAVPVGAEGEAVTLIRWARPRTPDPAEVSALEALARSAAGAIRTLDLLSSLTRAKDRAEALHAQALRELEERERAEEALKRSEAALRAARDEAEEANRAKSRFLATASHDLRQPVMAAGLYVDLLTRRLRDNDARALADMVQVSLDGLRGLLNGLLETARLEAGVVRPEVTAFALDDLLQRLSVEFETQVLAARLWLQVPHTLAVVRTDVLLLELMLRNLIGNALKYTVQGGVTVEAVEEGDSICIEVRDTGPGIPAEEQGRIFEDFFRTHAAAGRAKGFGLGLATVRRAAELLGHEVTVRSEPGQGAVFRVRVPRAVEGGVSDRQAVEVEPRRPSGRTVLVAEDDPLIAEALGLEFGEWGLDVVKTGGLAETRACVEARDLPVDLVVSDYLLGDGDGLEAIRVVRERWPVPAILLTGNTAAEVLRRARDEEVLLLHKPVLGPDLARAVAEALDLPN